ncbi:tetratricopeptide repeat protein [Marinoscillum furvescens]|uniref:Tetratricopeptide repeat protein n=1 Tax=Marinoscillum furvescens DSM 4134 TaxID=1122208 RepID=A0A3D9L071_MARFU|nr:tetratricopeptide repeat protein [Marinoscillum furvescens]RED94377.1 tetratricopeptide repeat protein [Marinoscillum furvescens DSM 4134]
MKRTYILAVAMVLAVAGYAQKKPKINKANSARENGDLVEAKSIIDAAIEHEKTKDDGKTWYYRGLIYATLDTTSNEQFSALAENALEEATEAFAKAEEIDPEGKNYYVSGEFGIPVLMEQQISNYYSHYYNKAVTAFQNSEFEEAVEAFENSYAIVPEDTNSYVNAAYAAHNGELYDDAVRNYRLAIDNGATSKDLYYNYVNILATAMGEKEKALEVIDEALEQFPADGPLSKNKVNILIELGKIDEAKGNLEDAIKSEPDNENLYFTLGVLYDELDNMEKANEAYKSAIEINPEHYESNFNYGVNLINSANEIIKESNNLGMSKADQKKAKELEPVIQEKLKEALPQWEHIHKIAPTDKTAIETLAYIYTQLKMYDKAEEMSEKLDNL